VSKKAPSGEYISKGSFMVYGKKNIIKTELKLGIGFKGGAILPGPEKRSRHRQANMLLWCRG